MAATTGAKDAVPSPAAARNPLRRAHHRLGRPEGNVAVTAGLAAGSIALVGFGIDSGIEVFAASVVLWQLHAGATARQRPALRAISVSFFLLGGAVGAVRGLIGAAEEEQSPVGIVLNVVALAVVIPVATVQGEPAGSSTTKHWSHRPRGRGCPTRCWSTSSSASASTPSSGGRGPTRSSRWWSPASPSTPVWTRGGKPQAPVTTADASRRTRRGGAEGSE